MTYELRNGNGEVLRCPLWEPLCQLAKDFFWPAQRPQPPPDEFRPTDARWSGDYFTADWAEVTEADAEALASALERAYGHVLEHEFVGHHKPCTRCRYIPGAEDRTDLSCGDNKRAIADLIRFCREGAFLIGSEEASAEWGKA